MNEERRARVIEIAEERASESSALYETYQTMLSQMVEGGLITEKESDWLSENATLHLIVLEQA
jgi:uncharacterized protein YutE (UPF0331/DUF86 family)